MKKVYKIVVGESINLPRDYWLVEASSLAQAVKKAESKRREAKDLYRGWGITSATEIGELAK